MFHRRIFGMLAGHACLLAGVAFSQVVSSPPGTAIPVSYTQTYTFLPVGLASTETAQINVVNTSQTIAATAAGTANPVAQPSCTGTVSFLNASGSAIGKPVSFKITAGQIFSATLPYGSLGITGTARAVVRGEISVSSPTFAAPNVIAGNSCSLAYSFETYDTATGVTHVFTNATSPSGFVVPLLGTVTGN